MKRFTLGAIALLFVLPLVFISCGSAKKNNFVVEPLGLFNADAETYLFIPIAEHKDFVSSFLTQTMGLSQKDASSLASRLSDMYIASSAKEVELASWGNFPQMGINSAFKEKNGWKKEAYKSSLSYYTNADFPFELSFPSQQIVMASKKVEPMLDRYLVQNSAKEGNAKDWIMEGGKDIRFYLENPDAYLQSLSAYFPRVGMDAVFGTLSKASEEAYNLNFTAVVSNKVLLPAVQGAFGMIALAAGGTVQKVDESSVAVSGMAVTKEQLLMVLSSMMR